MFRYSYTVIWAMMRSRCRQHRPRGWGFLLPTRPRKSCMMQWLLIVLLMLCTLLVTASHIADIPHLPCGFTNI